ncbi:MAG: 16S rRNA (guanine(966)-N(2))-methyltransferase RsmD [Prevotellaceae bacterium]|jgi:16S rRNA (guanine(966)-N(2))-methyltransferase RsmD|nr:16S rRNA (guanine(966)-N(2))-methyltransferase RsmD [Prevotellaceae bacterium]
MRIISGTFKGKRIFPPKNMTARPTTDFAKESLFNLLANMIDFEETEALDLFAGTGSIGFELASRGCRNVISVEKNHHHSLFIQKTIDELKIDAMSVVKADVFKFVLRIHKQFDLIFADPPYDLKELAQVPDIIFSNNLLKPESLLVLEHSANTNFENHPCFLKHRNYGSVNFSFFENKDSSDF